MIIILFIIIYTFHLLFLTVYLGLVEIHIFFDKPIITMEGKSLKQNHTFGFLKRINQNNLITSNENILIRFRIFKK